MTHLSHRPRHAACILAVTAALSSGCAESNERVSAPAGPTPPTEPAWAWEGVASQGRSLNAVWGVGDVALAVGDSGVVLRFEGGAWMRVRDGSGASLHGVAGNASGTWWAVGDGGLVLRYESGTWTEDAPTSRDLHDVWMSDSGEVFAVGVAGCVVTFRNGAWSEATVPGSPDLNAVWGTTSTNVYAGGAAGTLVHFDGSTWTSVDAGATGTIHDVWGRGEELFAVGASGMVRHRDGDSWQDAGAGATLDLYAVAGTGSDVFVAGRDASLFHYDGTTWTPRQRADHRAVHALWIGEHDVALGADGLVLERQDDEWRYRDEGRTINLWGVWGVDGLVLAVGLDGSVLRRTGERWMPVPAGTTEDLFDVWGASPRDVFVVGDRGTILHFDGSAWRDMESGTAVPLWGVWGSSETDVFAVGNGGTIRHFDGLAWSDMPSPSGLTLRSVWGTGQANVYAVGDFGTILRFDGDAWQPVNGASSDYWFQDVGGFSATQVFAVGEDLGIGTPTARHGQGVLVSFDGTAWTTVHRRLEEDLLGIGGSATDALTVGAVGFFLMFDGTTWSPGRLATTAWLRAVWEDPNGARIVVGDGGTILRFGRSRRSHRDPTRHRGRRRPMLLSRLQLTVSVGTTVSIWPNLMLSTAT